MVQKESKQKDKEFSLINKLKNIDLFDKTNFYSTLPNYIANNLKHELRPYQQQALLSLDWTQKQINANKKYNQLLFNMATGSGKTDLMAAIILYMYYEFDYHNFLFVVNSDGVVLKTIENLTNMASQKYLYKQPILIDGTAVSINRVNSFPKIPNKNDINIRLSTIQGLCSELMIPKENGLTFEELGQNKLVVLGDEAHHYNSRTKKDEKIEKTWEMVLDRVRNQNPENRQFEFTATMDWDNDLLYEKYKDKVVYQYTLDTFINDGYSKKVYRLQANGDDETKMLNAVLLSQYRKRIAKERDIPDFKPVILFKSNIIKASHSAHDKFLNLMNELDPNNLISFIKKEKQITQSEVLETTYNYWLSQDPVQTVLELKHDFNQKRIIDMNSKEKLIDDVNTNNLLNTLEDPNNPIRTIFAVAKLSEGWDVLNLYDIVRISEGKTFSKKQTDSEAQLIGRGARYNPFIYNGEKSYTRRFDNQDLKSEMLERLYYHTINDSRYLKNLKKSLDEMNLIVQEDGQYRNDLHTEVKNSFKRTKVYKYGNIYYNEIEDIPDKDYSSIIAYGIDLNDIAKVSIIKATTENAYNEIDREVVETELRVAVDFKNNNDYRLIRKGIAKNDFFRFDNLRRYMPMVHSIREFIQGDNWLGSITLYAEVVAKSPKLTIDQRLEVLIKYLDTLETKIKHNYRSKRGTNRFKALPINEVVKPYDKKVSINLSGKESARIDKHQIKDKWYVYDYAIVDNLEWSLVQLIKENIDKFTKKYKDVYLIRIEEQLGKLKLHDFGKDVSHYEAYMPDFVLYLKDEDYSYQIYIEPKGDKFILKDQWKEKLLEKINPEKIKLVENENVKIYGVKFFLKNQEMRIFNELKEKKIID